ncbi:hypothetical protein [Reichenbachiella ulvae]|uniref:Uncharacterized protein n=1 Tax=Reichenbachiella ulvae TaxID=2980104 RepID=A0ABT3D134_9BACT|nr:hypothetical protein [Reichenbachiella ulvae]MCV9389528.1 hypothetical protein [Reichenbachiella ulvae]
MGVIIDPEVFDIEIQLKRINGGQELLIVEGFDMYQIFIYAIVSFVCAKDFW